MKLIDWWECHGILVDTGEGQDSITSTFVDKALDPGFRDRWQNAWKKKGIRRERSLGVFWDGLDTPSDFANYNDMVDLALAEELRTMILGIEDIDNADGVYSVSCNGVEVTQLLSFDLSREYRRTTELAVKPIPLNEQTMHLWNERFKSLARYSRQIVIVDQYAVRNIDTNKKGLFALFNYLDRDASGCYVTVYSSIDTLDPDGVRVKHLDGLMREEISRYNRKGIREVTVYLTPDFNSIYKERYIRFDQAVCEIGHWLEAVGMSKASMDYSFAYSGSKIKCDQVRETERRLEDGAFPPFQYSTKN